MEGHLKYLFVERAGRGRGRFSDNSIYGVIFEESILQYPLAYLPIFNLIQQNKSNKIRNKGSIFPISIEE